MALRASLAEHAHRVLPEKLRAGERLLQNLLDRRAQTLIHGARLLAADYGFREAVASNDAETIVSVLANHGARIGATEVALLATDFSLRATTTRESTSLVPLSERLATQSAASGQASVVTLRRPAVPGGAGAGTRAPLVVGWVLMDFPLDAQLVADMQRLASLDLTLLSRESATEPWAVSLTSLDAVRAAGLATERWLDDTGEAAMTSVAVGGEELGVRMRSLGVGRETGDAGARRRAPWSRSRSTRRCACRATYNGADRHHPARHRHVRLRQRLHRAPRDHAAARPGRCRRASGPRRLRTPMQGQQRDDEIGELSQSFERMRRNIAENQAQILKLAYWDSLTGLPNRARFREAVNEAIAAAAPGGSVAIVMLDLNRFKHVNDVLGYRIGDLLLVQVAERLQSPAGARRRPGRPR